MVRTIDVRHLGREHVIAAHVVGEELIVDPGPTSALENWADELDFEPRALLLTHIHLDHAGAAGVLARRFGALRVYVSEVGAPHLVDPSRLLRSAARLYGEGEMERLWGEVAPIPAERVVALSGGEEVEGFRVEHVPGHAGHHLCWLDLSRGDAYVGDMAGVRIPPGELTIAPTPPPEIDVSAWLRSLDLIERLDPRRLRMTHFGAADDVGEQLDRARETLAWALDLAARGREAFLEGYEGRARLEGARGAAAILQAAPAEQQWLGLERYLRLRSGG